MPYGKSDFKVIRVAPTLSTDAYSDNDVFFNPVPIPHAVLGLGGCSKLTAVTILNEDDVAHDFDLIFMSAARDLGTINDAVGSNSKWTNALAKEAGVLGVVKIDWSTNSEDLVNNLVYHTSLGNHGAAITTGLPMMLQSEDDSDKVYMAAVSRGGTPTVAADDYEIILHIEYR